MTYQTIWVAAAALLLGIPQAQACRCVATTLEQQVGSADKVFFGRPTLAHFNEQAYRVEGLFQVEKSFKGEAAKIEAFSTGLGGGDCGVEIAVGQSYLIFMDQGKSRIGICSGSRQVGLRRMQELTGKLEKLVGDSKSRP